MDPELEPPLVHFAATDHDSVDTAVSTNPGGGGKLQRCEEKALMISVSSLVLSFKRVVPRKKKCD